MRQLFILYIVISSSCNNSLFYPNVDVIDTVSKKGQLAMGFGIQHSPQKTYNYGGVYSPISNLAISINGATGASNRMGFGLGLYKNYENKFFDFYFGLSKGWNIADGRNIFKSDNSTIEFQIIPEFTKPFCQLGYHYKTKRFLHDFNLKYDYYGISNITVVTKKKLLPIGEYLKANNKFGLMVLSYRFNFNTELFNFFISPNFSFCDVDNDDIDKRDETEFKDFRFASYMTMNFGATYRLDLKK